MDGLKAIAETLALLNFSFWQIVVLIALFVFKKPLAETFKRISKLNVAGQELHLETTHKRSELLELKNELAANDLDKDDIRKNTLRRIQPSLDTLIELGLIRVEKVGAYEAFDNDLVYKMTVYFLSAQMTDYVQTASEY